MTPKPAGTSLAGWFFTLLLLAPVPLRSQVTSASLSGTVTGPAGAIGEFPDDRAAARNTLAGGSQGNVRSETLRAFTEAEFKKIIASLP